MLSLPEVDPPDELLKKVDRSLDFLRFPPLPHLFASCCAFCFSFFLFLFSFFFLSFHCFFE